MHDDRFDQDIARRLRAYESHIPGEDPPPPGVRPSGRLAGWWVLALGGAAVAAAGLFLALTYLNLPSAPTGQSSPSPTPTLAPTPEGSPGVAPSGITSPPTAAPTDVPPVATAIAWSPDVTEVADAYVSRITAENGRFYALGSDGQGAAIWSSQDGRSWEKATLPFPEWWPRDVPQPPYQIGADLLVSVNGRLIALGSVGTEERFNVVVWESIDGITWTEIDTSPFREAVFGGYDVTNGPAGLVVAASHLGTGGSAWHSSDGGHTWTEHSPPGSFDGLAVVGTGTEYVMAGGVGPRNIHSFGPDPSAQHPRIWSSSNGEAWTELPLEGSDRIGQVDQLTVDGSGRWTAVGTLDGRVVGWHSEDGKSWQLGTDFRPMPPFSQSGLRLVGTPDGFVAFDAVDPVSTWISSDGITWTSAHQDPPVGAVGVGWAAGIGRVGDAVLVAGSNPASGRNGWFSWMGTIQR